MNNRIDFKENKYVANGNKYHINYNLTISRYRIYKPFSIGLAFNMDLAQLITELNSIREYLEDPKQMDGAAYALMKVKEKLFNLQYNFAKTYEDQEPILMFCTLFLNREDENIAEWNESMANSKIDDWIAEGTPMEDFFLLFQMALTESVKKFAIKDLHNNPEK